MNSGTHAQSDIAVAACFISDVRRWGDFETKWREALEDYGIAQSGFHMTDFVAHEGPFDRSDKERDGLIKRLVDIITERQDTVLGGMVSAVAKSDYDSLVTGRLREKLGVYRYTFAIQICMAMIEEWIREWNSRGEAIRYILDQMGKCKNEINGLFDDLIANDLAVHFGIESSGWSFDNRRMIVQLQSSDILAWEGNKYARDFHFSTTQPT